MPESSNSLFPSAQPVPLLVMAQQDMCDGQADQLGVGYVQGLAWTGPGEPARGDDAVGQFHIECDQEGVQVGDHDGLQGPDVCEHADSGHPSLNSHGP